MVVDSEVRMIIWVPLEVEEMRLPLIPRLEWTLTWTAESLLIWECRVLTLALPLQVS